MTLRVPRPRIGKRCERCFKPGHDSTPSISNEPFKNPFPTPALHHFFKCDSPDPREINQRLAEAVAHAGTEHRAFDPAQAYGLSENFLIWAATRAELLLTGALGSSADLRFAHIERFDPDRILQRGIGLCGQVAILTELALRGLGYDARAVGIAGHVVVETKFDDGFWILDPDYGVAFRGSLRYAEQNPGVVAAAYAARDYSAETAAVLAEMFGPEGNQTNGRYIGDTMWLVGLAEWLEHVLPALTLVAAAAVAAPGRMRGALICRVSEIFRRG